MKKSDGEHAFVLMFVYCVVAWDHEGIKERVKEKNRKSISQPIHLR